MIQTKRFRADDNLLLLVMRQQAGTLAKAALEGVMNSIDAGATRIDLTLTPDRLIIADNGKGINAVQEVDDFFAKMGTPHAMDANGHSTDAKFGKFRLGRGQLFNYGKNTWRTGPFNLVVDINAKGLDFAHEDDLPVQPGCTITIELYERITASDMLQIQDEIIRNCKYVSVDLLLNGNRINTPPETVHWTEITADAYIKVSESTRGVDFYQQGVFVQTIPSWTLGASGIVVTKEAVALNISRNDVIRTDARFQRIIAKFKKDSEVRARAKRDLTEDERIALLNELASGAAKWRDNLSAKLFLDTTGRGWSINALRRLPGQETHEVQGDGTLGYCFASRGDRRADRAMQSKLGLVFDVELLGQISGKPEDFFDGIDYSLKTSYSHVPLVQMSKAADTLYRLVAPAQQTATETRVLSALNEISDFAMRAKADLTGEVFQRDDRRMLRVGEGEADGWTDGESYIAINRAFLKNCGTGWGFVALADLLIHEWCHDQEDKGTHTHGLEFYKLHHDILSYQGTGFCRACTHATSRYEIAVAKEAKTVSRTQQKQALKNSVHAANEALLAAS